MVCLPLPATSLPVFCSLLHAHRACNCAMSLSLHLPLHWAYVTSCGDLPRWGESAITHGTCHYTGTAILLPVCGEFTTVPCSKPVTAQQAFCCTAILPSPCGGDPVNALRVCLIMQQPVTALWSVIAPLHCDLSAALRPCHCAASLPLRCASDMPIVVAGSRKPLASATGVQKAWSGLLVLSIASGQLL